MSDPRIKQAFLAAIRVLSGYDVPEPLVALAARIGELSENEIGSGDLDQALADAFPADPIVIGLGEIVSKWDAETRSNPWSIGTVPLSTARRQVVCSALGLSEAAIARLAELRPVLHEFGYTVISEKRDEFSNWYTPSRASEHEFYWPRYRDYLRDQRGWDDEALQSLDSATNQIVERFSDPTDPEPSTHRGLVVGHVQSGKTANFTGVIAKAVDAGYRLVIVLTGMHEALRRQTQRRLDMELLGKRNVLLDLTELQAMGTAQGEYLDDPSWKDGFFSDLRGDPPRPEFERLTAYKGDFNKHKVNGLRFKAADQIVPLYAPTSLYSARARIAVVKKNKNVLDHLLQAMRANEKSMREVPTLIIDDESDQASVNTTRPSWRTKEDRDEAKSESVERKKINDAISKILKLTPRAQYVGYTATPFANVFIDPADDDDIFPRDFIIALGEPKEYMGASSFFDIEESTGESRRYQLTNREAYIRELTSADHDTVGQDKELRDALASFIVTGAVKLYRENRDPELSRYYLHHTMLVHEATQRAKHADLADRIVNIWNTVHWLDPAGIAVLREAFEDLRPTIEDRTELGIPFVDNFNAIEPFLSEAINRIEYLAATGDRKASNCVLVVNSDTEVAKKLDFDRQSTWKVIVGGAMLSRGFTIEGLTISYFRRSPRAHDTLLQMGRWFGFRPGYRDLVRVYLATVTSISKTRTVNLYEAFVAIVETENEFRRQLDIYSRQDGTSPPITPRQVRPLVQQTLPWLKPTAANKMYNARIKMQREAIFSPKAMNWEPSSVAMNWDQTTELVKAGTRHIEFSSDEITRRFGAWVGTVSVDVVSAALKGMHWLDDYYELVVRPKAAYYLDAWEKGKLEDFVIAFPQGVEGHGKPLTIEIPGLGERTVVTRTRNAKEYYGEYTDPAHRSIAEEYVKSGGRSPEAFSSLLGSSNRGIILAYLIRETGPKSPSASAPPSHLAPENCSVGLTIYLPNSAITSAAGDRIVFEGIDSSRED